MMSKKAVTFSLIGALGLGFVLGALFTGYAMRLAWSERIASEFSLKVGDVEIAKMPVEGKPMLQFISKSPPVAVSWISSLSNAVVTGHGFELAVDVCPEGALKDYSLIDLPDGMGTITWADGRQFVAQVKAHKIDSSGRMTYPDGRVEEGQWKDGKLIKAEKSP
jgi:hypothetical protein